jgi:hypothetical protein
MEDSTELSSQTGAAGVALATQCAITAAYNFIKDKNATAFSRSLAGDDGTRTRGLCRDRAEKTSVSKELQARMAHQEPTGNTYRYLIVTTSKVVLKVSFSGLRRFTLSSLIGCHAPR